MDPRDQQTSEGLNLGALIEQRMSQVANQITPPVDQGGAVPPTQPQPTPNAAPAAPQNVELSLPDGSKQTVSYEKLLQMASQVGEVERRRAEVAAAEERVRPLQALELWARSDPANVAALNALVKGELKPPPATPVQDDFDFFAKPTTQAVPPGGSGLESRLANLERQNATMARILEDRMVKDEMMRRAETGKAEMRHYPIFNQPEYRNLGEYLLERELANPSRHPVGPDQIVREVARVLETHAQTRVQARTNQASQTSRIAGGPPLAAPAATPPPKEIDLDRLEYGGLKELILKTLALKAEKESQ